MVYWGTCHSLKMISAISKRIICKEIPEPGYDETIAIHLTGVPGGLAVKTAWYVTNSPEPILHVHTRLGLVPVLVHELFSLLNLVALL